MNLGQFRAATESLPDNTPLLVGFQDFQKDRFVMDGVAVRPAGDLAEVKKKYGWEAFGALPGTPVILFAFDPETRKPPKPKAADSPKV